MIITLKDGNIEAEIESVGARINALRINGVDIVLGFNSVEDYNKSGCYAGATVGRVANRIAKAKNISSTLTTARTTCTAERKGSIKSRLRFWGRRTIP